MTVTYNNTTYFYVTNLQGDIVAILDSSGAAVVKYTYDAWGKLLTTTGSMATTLGEDNPLRYRGYVYDIETGLYYLQSRYYDPEIGRFINADGYSSTGQGLLCNNNPTTLVDSDGKIPKSCSREIIAMALFGVTVLAAVSTSTSKSKAKPIVVTKPTRDENDKYYVGRVLTEHFASRMSHHNG